MKSIYKIFILVFIISSVSFSESYRILGIFPFNAKSHDVMFTALMRGLAKHNHQVDVITHFPEKNPPKNYNVLVNLNGTLESIVNTFCYAFLTKVREDVPYQVATAHGNFVCNLLSLAEIQKVIKNPPSDPPYDVVITETFGANCFMGIGHLLKVPVIAVASAVEYPWISDFTGNNDNLAFVPVPYYQNFDKTRFWDRFRNFFAYYRSVYRFQSITEKVQTDLMRKHISPDIPNIREVEKNTALILINSHPIIYGAKPLTPSIVQVSGLHIEENTSKLTPELQKWLDESDHGVIYFTFGSLVLLETFPRDFLEAVYASVIKIAPIRVLMKIVDTNKLPPGLPKNIKTLPWIPQQPVLAHKNVRAFVSHGGLQSSLEALYYGIPTVGIPLFADQLGNIERFVAMNMTIKLNLEDLTTSTLDDVLNEILNNPAYRNNAKRNSKLYRDRPMSGTETAIFWIEYVIRNGPDSLKSPAHELRWWQLYLLDIFGLILLIFILIISLAYYFITLMFKKAFAKPTRKPKTP